jgi:hypothetical protein
MNLYRAKIKKPNKTPKNPIKPKKPTRVGVKKKKPGFLPTLMTTGRIPVSSAWNIAA